jgi:hypothetical protein
LLVATTRHRRPLYAGLSLGAILMVVACSGMLMSHPLPRSTPMSQLGVHTIAAPLSVTKLLQSIQAVSRGWNSGPNEPAEVGAGRGEISRWLASTRVHVVVPRGVPGL